MTARFANLRIVTMRSGVNIIAGDWEEIRGLLRGTQQQHAEFSTTD
jgi:hypothetical protein